RRLEADNGLRPRDPLGGAIVVLAVAATRPRSRATGPGTSASRPCRTSSRRRRVLPILRPRREAARPAPRPDLGAPRLRLGRGHHRRRDLLRPDGLLPRGLADTPGLHRRWRARRLRSSSMVKPPSWRRAVMVRAERDEV